MPTEPDDAQPKADDQPDASSEPFSGVGKFVENNDVAGLMAELDKVPTDTKEAILNKLSISDGNGGRIELDGHQMVPMPGAMRKQVEQELKKHRKLERGDGT